MIFGFEGWVTNWYFQIIVLEKTLQSSLDSKVTKPVNPKGNQLWIFVGRTDAKAETPTLWPPDVKRWITGKDCDAGENERQKKGAARDDMVGWHHWLNGHEFEQTPGDSEGQGSLASCGPWGHKELDTTEQLNKNNNDRNPTELVYEAAEYVLVSSKHLDSNNLGQTLSCFGKLFALVSSLNNFIFP